MYDDERALARESEGTLPGSSPYCSSCLVVRLRRTFDDDGGDHRGVALDPRLIVPGRLSSTLFATTAVLMADKRPAAAAAPGVLTPWHAAPDHRLTATKLDPPIYAFFLVLSSAIGHVVILCLVDNLFRATGGQPGQLPFAISRHLAGLAAFVNTPKGLVAALFAAFAWCRSSGWVIRWLMCHRPRVGRTGRRPRWLDRPLRRTTSTGWPSR